MATLWLASILVIPFLIFQGFVGLLKFLEAFPWIIFIPVGGIVAYLVWKEVRTAINKERVKRLTQRAEAGETAAQSELGLTYQAGIIVPKDMALAVKWLTAAADKADSSAQFNLGMMYWNGDGIPAEPTKGISLIRSSAFGGNNLGCTEMGKYYTITTWPDYQLGFLLAESYFKKASDAGNMEANHRLGLLHRSDEFQDAVECDESELTQWWQKSIDQAFDLPKLLLAEVVISRYGSGSEHQEAINRFKQFAEKTGRCASEAQRELGRYFLEQQGEANLQEARMWLKAPAEQGDKEAQFLMGSSIDVTDGDLGDGAELRKWYQLAADQGHPEAQYLLGCCYLSGIGGNTDPELGKQWITKASEQGYEEATELLDKMETEGSLKAKN